MLFVAALLLTAVAWGPRIPGLPLRQSPVLFHAADSGFEIDSSQGLSPGQYVSDLGVLARALSFPVRFQARGLDVRLLAGADYFYFSLK